MRYIYIVSRGPGKYQQILLVHLQMVALSDSVYQLDGTWWHSMSGLAADMNYGARAGNYRHDHATLRRAVRSLERGGYVQVQRSMVITTAAGRQAGHVQNVVQITPRGHAYLNEAANRGRTSGPGSGC